MKYRRAYQAKKKWSKRIYILFVTIFLGSRPVRSDVSVYQIFEGRAERRSGIRFRVVGSLSRIPALLPPRPLHPLWFFLSVRPEPALFLPLSPSEIG